MRFTLGQGVDRIGREPARVTDCGLIVELEALKPMARLPWPSIAALPIQRQVVSGW